MGYNLTETQKSVLVWMVEANREGELDEEFVISWLTGGHLIINQRRTAQPEDTPDITRGVLDALNDAGLVRCDINYDSRTRRSGGTKNRPQFKETQVERSRRCTLTQKAYDAVDSDFVEPQQPPSGNNFIFNAPVSNSIVGTQNRAELTNNLDFGELKRRIEAEGAEDKEELRLALEQIERLVERGEYLNRGDLARFSEAMERHGWFTGAVMSALLGFATQIVS